MYSTTVEQGLSTNWVAAIQKGASRLVDKSSFIGIFPDTTNFAEVLKSTMQQHTPYLNSCTILLYNSSSKSGFCCSIAVRILSLSGDDDNNSNARTISLLGKFTRAN